MPRQTDKERVKRWHERITAADKAYKAWSDKFFCEEAEEFYYGPEQWGAEQSSGSLQEQKYIVNLCFSTVEVRIPSLMFYRPQVNITPRPARGDDPMSNIEDRAQLQKDTLNTFLDDPALGFRAETTLALRESFPRFGVGEVGYSADFIDNPNAGKPILLENGEEAKSPEGKEMVQPERILQDERLFVKWIPARQFRVPANSKQRLEQNDWCGYFEWHYPEDLRRNQRYKNTSGLKTTGRARSDDAPEDVEDGSNESMMRRGLVKVWKIWDIRGKMRLVFVENGEKFLFEQPFKRLPFFVLKFHEQMRPEFYPIPPMSQWLSLQLELNDTREGQRVHRKRFKRRFTRLKGSIDTTELEKLKNAEDGTIVESLLDDPIKPVQDAPLDAAITRNIPLTKEDFREVSGVTGEERGIADSETATQANIVNTRSRIRESYSRQSVANWLADGCRLMLKTIKEHMELPIWIKRNVDPVGPAAVMEAARVAILWKQIQAESLGNVDNADVSVDIDSLSPLSEEERRQSWERCIQILVTNPTIALSELLLKKTLAYYGIRSDKEIKALQQWAIMLLQMQASAAMAKAGGGAPSTPETPGPGATPTNAGIEGQLEQQMIQ